MTLPKRSVEESKVEYPDRPSDRARWILERRGPRRAIESSRPVAVARERERAEDGSPAAVGVLFLANRECPWRCLMCDLWWDTLEETVPGGAISEQIRRGLDQLRGVRRLKLYNAGSYFDPRAIPPEEDAPVATLLEGFERVIVESHPALIGERCFRFARLLHATLEVGMGLETTHPKVLPRLNKGMTVESFRRAAAELASHDIALRSFVLVGIPFVAPGESLEWCRRSVGFAFDCGSSVVSLIPTRTGNGALDALAERGEFTPPTLRMLEEAASEAIALRRGRAFADLWGLERLNGCGACFDARRRRLEEMNLTQTIPPPIPCTECGGGV